MHYNGLTDAVKLQEFIKPKLSQNEMFSGTLSFLSASCQPPVEFWSGSVTHKSDTKQPISINCSDKYLMKELKYSCLLVYLATFLIYKLHRIDGK